MTAVASAATPAIEAGERRLPITLIATLVAVLLAIGGVALFADGNEIVGWLAIGIMLVAAAEDLRTRRLRNAFVAPALVFALAADPTVATAAAAVVAVLPFLFFAFWKPGSIGMGDVKFAAPAGALAGFEGVGSLLVVIALLGGVLSIVAFARFGRSGTLAYGPAIALGTLLVAFVLN